MLTEDARLKRNAYQRRWRAQNKKKVAEINERYWERQAEKGEEGEAIYETSRKDSVSNI